MKNVLKGVLVALAAVSLVFGMAACGGGGGPTAATKAFVAALEKGDLKAMEKVATPETVELMGAFMEKAEQQGDGEKPSFGKVTYGDEKIDGDTATVMVTFSEGNMKDQPTPFTLKKVGGKWKVHLSMEK